MTSEPDLNSVARTMRVVSVTNEWAIGELECCLVAIWRGQPTSDILRLRADELSEITRRFPGRCALLEIVEPTSKPPSDETRRVAMEVFRRLGADLAAIGFTVEGSELRSALTRAIITGMLFFVKQPQPTKVFRNVSETLQWLKLYLHRNDSDFETQLMLGIEYLRKQISLCQISQS